MQRNRLQGREAISLTLFSNYDVPSSFPGRFQLIGHSPFREKVNSQKYPPEKSPGRRRKAGRASPFLLDMPNQAYRFTTNFF